MARSDAHEGPAPALREPLRAILEATVAGMRLSDGERERLARSCDRTLAEIDVLVGFVERLRDPARTAPLRRCVGTTCRLRESALRRDDLVTCLGASGIERAVEPVHCFDACDRGPNYQFEGDLYSEGSQSLGADDRAWRAGGVARPVTDVGPPVRD